MEHSYVQAKLFDMFTKVEAARQLCRSAFVYNWSNPPEKRVPEYGFTAKNLASQTALEVTNAAIQILGSNGLSPEYLTEKLFRDARTTLICDGSNDVLSIIGGYTIAHTYPRRRQ